MLFLLTGTSYSLFLSLSPSVSLSLVSVFSEHQEGKREWHREYLWLQFKIGGKKGERDFFASLLCVFLPPPSSSFCPWKSWREKTEPAAGIWFRPIDNVLYIYVRLSSLMWWDALGTESGRAHRWTYRFTLLGLLLRRLTLRNVSRAD